MPFYLVLFTETEFCITSNKQLPDEFGKNMDAVKKFDSEDEAEMYVYETLTGGDLWDFGILSFDGSNQIEIGKVYHRNKKQ